jgi:hypothetical protein
LVTAAVEVADDFALHSAPVYFTKGVIQGRAGSIAESRLAGIEKKNGNC